MTTSASARPLPVVGYRLRVYIGAAPGVGKSYEMLQEAHALRARGLDVVVGLVETSGRRDTEALVRDLEVIPRRKIEYRGVVLEEMDVEAIIKRRPLACVVDELAHTNVTGSRNAKRYQDVLEILDAGVHVMTAVNIQHLETLNDAVARATGVRVRETVPDTFLDRADEVINVVVRVRAERPSDGLVAFAQREGVTHVIFGQSARSRWELVMRGSTLDKFLSAVPDAAVQVVPLDDASG